MIQVADERLEKTNIKLNEPARIAGQQYEEGDTVEVYGFEAERFVAEGWAKESKAKAKNAESKDK